jgi:GAF domain-containing protein
MAFALQLQASLRQRSDQLPGELAAGDSLETILGRHLLAVEAAAETELLTSILLLDEAGKQLWHGAAPSLPSEYCEAINGIEIGPSVGSCGTAAYLDRAVYVTDIASDHLWRDYRDLADQHGLRACWSTPIHDAGGLLLGTFAVYHPTPRSPTPDEVEAIRMISGHVAEAITKDRSRPQLARTADLRLIGDNDDHALSFDIRFEAYAAKLDKLALRVTDPRLVESLKAVAADCRRLAGNARNRQTSTDSD